MTLRVDGFEIFDRVTGFEDGFINREFAEKFTNDEGELVAYNRAEAIISGDISAGEKPKISLDETVVMKKVFVCVTVTTSEMPNISDRGCSGRICRYSRTRIS